MQIKKTLRLLIDKFFLPWVCLFVYLQYQSPRNGSKGRSITRYKWLSSQTPGAVYIKAAVVQ